MFDYNGKFLHKFGSSGPGRLSRPLGIASDSANNWIVTDDIEDRVAVFNSNGDFLTAFGESGFEAGQFSNAHDVCVDNNGRILVCDDTRVQVFAFESQ